MRLEDVARDAPTFDFRAYFGGHVRASGWFADRFGRPRRHFCGDFVGRLEGECLVLDETLHFCDGVTEHRVWRVFIDADGQFLAESESLVDRARGQVKGNALAMHYAMRVATTNGSSPRFDFDDLMLLQPDGSLQNLTQVRKFGFRLGTVCTQYARHDGQATCASRRPPVAAADGWAGAPGSSADD